MPEISLFYGIRVTMYYEDHNPPHFHVEYNGNKAIVDIIEARVIKGALPSRQLKLILAWCVIHQDELMLKNKRKRKMLYKLENESEKIA